MKSIAIISFLLLVGLNGFASKDVPIEPTHFEFILGNNDTITCGQDSILEWVSDGFLENKITINSVKITFKSRESVLIIYAGNKVSSFSIIKKSKRIDVPQELLNKLPVIHYASFLTLYNQYEKKPFNKKRFSLRFNVGTEEHFGRYSHVTLIFKRNKYTSGHLVKRVGKDSNQSEEL